MRHRKEFCGKVVAYGVSDEMELRWEHRELGSALTNAVVSNAIGCRDWAVPVVVGLSLSFCHQQRWAFSLMSLPEPDT